MTHSYLDFELEIGANDGSGYPLAVLHSPAGNERSRLRLSLSGLELENRLLALEKALLRSGGKRRRVLSADESIVQSFGRELFAALFHDDIRALYFQSRQIAGGQDKGLRLKLRIHAPELAVLPWEYLFDDRTGEYVSLSQSTPVVRYLETAHALRPLAVTPPLRILGMMASPPNLPPIDIALEKARLERALAGARQRGLVQLEWLPGQSWRDLQRAMRQGPWHVFHFLGHGSFDSVREEGVLAMTDAGQAYPLPANQLARMLGDHPTLRLVLLNACEGGLASHSDIFASTAATLVQRGVPAVIAMQVEITEAAAIEFSSQFYEALAEGLPVDSAVTEARKAVSLAIANTLEWGIPVLMSRAPDGVIFDINAPAPPRPAEVKPPQEDRQPAQPSTTKERERSAPVATLKAAPKAVIDFDWVTIPSGEFLMGSDKQKDKQAYDIEMPLHMLSLPGYAISRTPVTVAQFAAFVQATDYRTVAEERDSEYHWRHPRGWFSDVSQKQKHPVTQVYWRDALAFCEWAGVRLPTEAEWEKAARGPSASSGDGRPSISLGNGRAYPWGDAPPTDKLCNFNQNVKDTTPVGNYPDGASPYGCLDMAGNVLEWTSSLWGKDVFKPDFGYPYDPSDGREDISAPDSVYRVVRGGSWWSDARGVRCAARHWINFVRNVNIGFRVVSPSF